MTANKKASWMTNTQGKKVFKPTGNQKNENTELLLHTRHIGKI